MGTAEGNTPTTRRENQKSDKTASQSEIAHRLSRAPTGGNITVTKCTNTVSFSFTALSHATGKQKLTGWAGDRGPGEPHRWTRARAVGAA